MIAARNSWCVAFDNLSGIAPWISDSLCRLATGGGFTTRELFSEKIDQFDLIVFDRYQHRGVLPILYFDNIARYVRDGGAVLIAAGPDYANDGSLYDTPLSPILPVAPPAQQAIRDLLDLLQMPFASRRVPVA